MKKTIRQQLHAAWEASGLTMGELLKRAKLDMDETSLGRKLDGKQSLRIEEAEAIARALKIALRAEARAS